MKRRLAGTLVVLVSAQVAAAETLTYVDLVKRLTDLERLAVLPAPGEGCAQCSSYDRASRYDEASGKYVAWDKNGDGAGCIRKEGGRIVMAEMKGPGCIWRIWSARAEKGHVRIYLDGATESVVDLPFIGYFDRTRAPFLHESLVHTTARGLNNYVPIPYQKSCKVVADRGWGRYYHFTYGTFPEGTKVPTFKMSLSPEETAALAEAHRKLTRGGVDPAGKRPGEATVTKTVTVAPGGTACVATLDGPRAVTAIRAKLDLPESPKDREVLRALTIQIQWDGESAPSVWSPLGDFFGTAAGANAYGSLPLGLTKEGEWYCLWYMPFAKSAVITLGNDGKQPRNVSLTITHAPLGKPVDALGRFHAKWHRDVFMPPEPERWIDWPMLVTKGRGRYCGVMLHVWNPRGGWWGEGDEKFHVDGEKFPSTFGTGSEDYFGYAWCNPTLFTNCYHNQTISMGNRGHVSVNRWHIADNVPFQKSFEGYIEKYWPNKKPTRYAAVAYWYLAAGQPDGYTPQPFEDRIGYWEKPHVHRVVGALEGEDLKVLGKTGGVVRKQDLTHYKGKWSDQRHLWWVQNQPGHRLDLGLPVKAAGKYRLVLQLTKAKDYAIVQLHLDGQPLGQPIDLYDPEVVPTGPIDMGTHELTAGQHKLTVEIVGANDKALKRYMAGVDYVQIVPARK